jgi:CxxC motif-containing protein (DUF1111 family)
LLNGVPNEPDNLDLVLFADFMRFLAPPPRGAITRDVRLGNLVFHRIGCSQCHVQLLVTGSNSVLALHRVAFQPFSDFLLHDMGSLGDGIPQDNATATEIRTSPLWGLSAQTRFLHDARAVTIEEAILAHDGQGKVAGDRFRYLNESDRRTLLAFLRSL